MSKKNEADTSTDTSQAADQPTVQTDPEAKDLAQATEAATKPQFTREQLEAMGLDPAPYGL